MHSQRLVAVFLLAGFLVSSRSAATPVPRPALALYSLRVSVPASAREDFRPFTGSRLDGSFVEGLIARTAAFTADDFDLPHATVVPSWGQSKRGQFTVLLPLKSARLAALRLWTQEHVGHSAALLLGDRLLAAVRVTAPTDGPIPIEGHLTEEAANQLLASIRQAAR